MEADPDVALSHDVLFLRDSNNACWHRSGVHFILDEYNRHYSYENVHRALADSWREQVKRRFEKFAMTLTKDEAVAAAKVLVEEERAHLQLHLPTTPMLRQLLLTLFQAVEEPFIQNLSATVQSIAGGVVSIDANHPGTQSLAYKYRCT
jgi:hypothetical protein